MADLERFQKTSQIIIIWLVPFIGAIGLWFFHRPPKSNINLREQEFGGGNTSDITSSSEP
jgi:hypothetical protein